MIIVAIEGLDKSGKHTQSTMLADRLSQLGFSVVQSEFHRYDTPTGKLIMDWLTRKYPVDQTTIELIMAADKQAQQSWFKELEAQGVDVLILDRYMASQQAYSKAAGMSPFWVLEITSHLRWPDLNILIDIDPITSMTRKGKHNNGENDRYESDLQLLTNVRANFKEVINMRSNVPGMIVDGTLPINDIHELIYQGVLAYVSRTASAVK